MQPGSYRSPDPSWAMVKKLSWPLSTRNTPPATSSLGACATTVLGTTNVGVLFVSDEQRMTTSGGCAKWAPSVWNGCLPKPNCAESDGRLARSADTGRNSLEGRPSRVGTTVQPIDAASRRSWSTEPRPTEKPVDRASAQRSCKPLALSPKGVAVVNTLAAYCPLLGPSVGRRGSARQAEKLRLPARPS